MATSLRGAGAVNAFEYFFPSVSGEEAHNARIERGLKRMAWVSWLLDECIKVPGTDQRIGLDGLLGVIPGAGDVLTGIVQFYMLIEAGHIGVQRSTLAKMLGNIVIDTTIGCIPIVGDLFDVLFKASRRNLDLARADLGVSEDPLDDIAGSAVPTWAEPTSSEVPAEPRPNLDAEEAVLASPDVDDAAATEGEGASAGV